MTLEQFKMTSQREIILVELKQCNFHPTADELFELVKKRLPRISLSTVYRNLEQFFEAGLIDKLEIRGRQKRFDWDVSEHDHIVCLECHKIDNIDRSCYRARPLRAMFPVQVEKGYAIVGCRVEFFGLCPVCKQDRKKGSDLTSDP